MCINFLIYLLSVGLVSASSTTSDNLQSNGYDNFTMVTVPDTSSIPESTPITTENDQNHQYSPFQVSLHYSYNDGFFCGGSIISPKMVLTAAHCMYYRWGGLMPPIIVTVSVGRQRLNESSWRTFEVANITLHPLFNKTTMINDLALVEIEGRFEADNIIGQIDTEKHIAPEVEYSRCIVTGWNQETSEYQVIEVVLSTCSDVDYQENICTYKKYPSDGLCIDNAGNPLICDGKLIGILSVEPACEDTSQLTIFEKIRLAAPWLNTTAFSNAIKNNFEYTRNVALLYILLSVFLWLIKNV